MAKVQNFNDSKVGENGFVESAGKFTKVAITNKGTTTMWVGKRIGNNRPNIELPPKPDDLPGYNVVFSTDNPDVALGNDITYHFDGGSGTADIVTFEVAKETAESTQEYKPGQSN